MSIAKHKQWEVSSEVSVYANIYLPASTSLNKKGMVKKKCLKLSHLNKQISVSD